MRALAARFRLPTVDLLADTSPDAQETRFFFGRYYPREAAQRDFAPVYAAIQEQLAAIGPEVGYDAVTSDAAFFDRMSIARWIDAYVPGGRRSPLGQLLDVTATTEKAVSIPTR